MKDSEAEASTNKPEEVQMVGIYTRCWVNLESVVVVGRVLKETVERIEHLMRKQEEELPMPMLAVLHHSMNK